MLDATARLARVQLLTETLVHAHAEDLAELGDHELAARIGRLARAIQRRATRERLIELCAAALVALERLT